MQLSGPDTGVLGELAVAAGGARSSREAGSGTKLPLGLKEHFPEIPKSFQPSGWEVNTRSPKEGLRAEQLVGGLDRMRLKSS